VLDVPIQHVGLISKSQNVEHQSLIDVAPYPRTMETSNSLWWRCTKIAFLCYSVYCKCKCISSLTVALHVSIGNRVKLKLHWQSYVHWH